MAVVDLALGPLVTLIIANPRKPRRELLRDIGVIVIVQLLALSYGTSFLWRGRPLYYAFSERVLQIVQAYDLEPAAAGDARERRLPLAPHWYSRPRWIWAPLPSDPVESERIIRAATSGGFDVIAMPRYYRPWTEGLPALHAQLKKIDDIQFFSAQEKARLRERLHAAGLAADQPDAMAFTGRGHPLLAVFDPATLALRAILEAQ
jgi:hypothetical protein